MTLVTAIMPTRGRSKWALQAIQCFFSQTYPKKELIILDDTEDPSLPDCASIGYTSLVCASGRMTIATKRNKLAGMARGEIIWTLDDDDWSAPERMADQVQRLQESDKAITGYNSILFHDGERGYRYKGPPTYALGTSLCYRRDWALANPFQDSPKRVDAVSGQFIASDNGVVAEANAQRQLVTVDGGSMIVARMHPGNTSSSKWVHRNQSPNYRPVALDQIPEGFAY